MSEKLYRVKLNSKGMPNFSTAVEVADRPQGEWEYHSNPAIGINPEDAFCSYCKYHIDTTMVDFDDYNFCPNCGADMREREGE